MLGDKIPPRNALFQQPFPPTSSARRLGPRAAMISGFGALLFLMAILSFDSIRLLHELEASSVRVRQDFSNGERTLEDIRSSLYESANILRDYSQDERDPNTREAFRRQFRSMRDRTNATLNSCLQSLSFDQRKPFENLSEELDNYWSMAERVLNSDSDEEHRSPLHRSTFAQHATVLAITRDVSALNDLELRDAERNIGEIFVQFRERLRTGTIVAFALGLLLAACTIVYVSRLERTAEEKYQESQRSHHELKELSKRLDDAQEQERRAISRELHDQVSQSLSALLLDVQTLVDAPQNGGTFRTGLQKIKVHAENCVNEVRNMALLLRPSMLDDLGLIAALEWQAREISKRSDLLVEVVDDHFADDLPEEYKTCVYRVAQQALHNCTRHAHAHRVRVTVQENSNHLVLLVEDDGIGFDPHRQRGMGLLGMQERVTRLGGSLTIESSPGHGTRIRVDLPLTPVSAPIESALL